MASSLIRVATHSAKVALQSCPSPARACFRFRFRSPSGCLPRCVLPLACFWLAPCVMGWHMVPHARAFIPHQPGALSLLVMPYIAGLLARFLRCSCGYLFNLPQTPSARQDFVQPSTAAVACPCQHRRLADGAGKLACLSFGVETQTACLSYLRLLEPAAARAPSVSALAHCQPRPGRCAAVARRGKHVSGWHFRDDSRAGGSGSSPQAPYLLSLTSFRRRPPPCAETRPGRAPAQDDAFTL